LGYTVTRILSFCPDGQSRGIQRLRDLCEASIKILLKGLHGLNTLHYAATPTLGSLSGRVYGISGFIQILSGCLQIRDYVTKFGSELEIAVGL
jgi:hypothetical protein